MRLENKNILVTAAAQGIGRSTAIAFAKEGANVIATDINEEKLIEIKANNSNIETYKLDSTNKLDVENFCSSINNINILFHAVGFVHHGAILDCDSEEFQRSINVNIYSAYLMSHSLLPKMIQQKKGNIAVLHLNPCDDLAKANQIMKENNCSEILWIK